MTLVSSRLTPRERAGLLARIVGLAPRRAAGPSGAGMPRRRVSAAGFGTLNLAAASAIGFVLISQVRPATDQPVTPAEVAVAEPALSSRISPWRDAWYLDDPVTTASAPPAAPAGSRTSLDLGHRTHDAWALPGPPARSLDLSIRAHDEWALSPAVTPSVDLSPRSHDDWPSV
jgi:hypothetical protein